MSLRHLYERWDGKGMPGEQRGDVDPAGGAADAGDPGRRRGLAARWRQALARHVVTDRAGPSGLDPNAVTAFLDAGGTFTRAWPPRRLGRRHGGRAGPQPVVTEDRLDACLAAVADFADLKSMWTVGHSRGVARLAGRPPWWPGWPRPDIVLVRRAGLVHDIGRVAVPVGVWAKPGPLTRDEREQVQPDAYHTERVLDVAPGLRPLARLAGSHGERCDGSGYHRGSP